MFLYPLCPSISLCPPHIPLSLSGEGTLMPAGIIDVEDEHDGDDD
jgi:hypothetical protein